MKNDVLIKDKELFIFSNNSILKVTTYLNSEYRKKELIVLGYDLLHRLKVDKRMSGITAEELICPTCGYPYQTIGFNDDGSILSKIDCRCV